MELAVACDITVAEEDSLFGAPEVRFGSGIVAMLLPWFIGGKKAKELLLTGDDRVTAADAQAMGLVNRVAPVGRGLEAATEVAETVAANDPVAVAFTKQAINRSLEVQGLSAALRQALEIDVVVESSETDESRAFNRLVKEQGAKAALQWRADRLRSLAQKRAAQRAQDREHSGDDS